MADPAWRRLAAELHRPFRGAWLAVPDLLAGTWALGGLLVEWVLAVPTWKARGERALGVLAGVFVGCWVASNCLAVCLPVVVVAWVVAASVFAPHRPVGRVERVAGTTPSDQETMGEQHPAALDDQLRLYVEQAIAGAKRNGHHGMHLSALLAGLHHHGHLTDWTVPDLGAHLRRMGIPVRDSVRVGEVTRVGVHHKDLHKHLGRAPRMPPHLVPDLTPPDPAERAPAAVP